MNAIEIRDLRKTFGARCAVDGLNLCVAEGEMLALLGQNGAGKTTTIKMLAGLLPPTSGDALLSGHSVVTETEKVKQIVNLSPQETAVASRLSVRENMVLMARLYGMEKRRAREKADEMLEAFHLSDRANDRAKKLSGGMQRRLSLALALISEPKILFLDEPTLGLDVRARRDLWTIVESLKGRMTIILTTHYMEEAEALSDRIAVIDAGKLKCCGTPAELEQQTGTTSLEEAFLSLTEGEMEA